MANGPFTYTGNVYNKSGYAPFYPMVRNGGELLEGVPPNPYATSATKLFPLETVIVSGRDAFMYCYNGGVALALGGPTQSAAANHAEADDNIVVGAISAIGAYTVSLTSTDNLDAGIGATEDAFEDGWLHLHSTAGLGQCYKIKSNKPFDAAESVVVFTLYYPLTIATSTSSLAGIVQNPCKNVIVTTAVVSGIFTGIPQVTVPINHYFWSKMAGPSSITGNAAIAKGTSVVIGTTAAAADPGAAASTEIIIGYPLTPYTSTDDKQFMVMLQGNLW